MFRQSLAALAAASLIAAPVFAQSAPAPVEPAVRAGANGEGASQLAGGPVLPPILFATIVVLGVLTATGVLFDDDDDGTPVSP